jgi:hypothetical protein
MRQYIKDILESKWRFQKCTAKDCWCGLIITNDKIDFGIDKEPPEQYFVAHAACLDKDIAKYIIKLHNKNLKEK